MLAPTLVLLMLADTAAPLTDMPAGDLVSEAQRSPSLKSLLKQPGQHDPTGRRDSTPKVQPAPKPIASFLTATCGDCHADGASEGGFAIDELSWQPRQPAAFAKWVRVLDRVESGEMPPADSDQPRPQDRATFVRRLTGPLVAADRWAQQTHGRGTIRRLNRSEYQTTLSDLLHTDLAIAEMLPEDARRHGFDTVGEALNLSSVQVESYLAALDVALTQATTLYPKPPVDEFRLKLQEAATFMQVYRKGGPFRVQADGVALFAPELFSHFNGVLPQWTAPYDGRYRITVSAYTMQSDEPVVLTLRAGGTGHSESAHVPSVDLDHFVVPVGTPETPVDLTWEGDLQRGHYLHLSPSSLRPMRFANNEKGLETKIGWDGPGVLVRHVDVAGPFFDQWPPASHRSLWGDLELASVENAVPLGDPNAHLRGDPDRVAEPALKRTKRDVGSNKRFVYDGPVTIGESTFGGEPIYRAAPIPKPVRSVLWVRSEQPHVDAERLLRDFLPRAFRQDAGEITDADVRPYLDIAKHWMTQGASFEQAMRTAYQAVLCSPQFLYHRDSLPAEGGTLSNAALAERLAFFLWNGPPDAELLAADLADPSVRREQAERLLADPRRDRFLTHLLDEWLDLRLIDFTAPDSSLYPEHDVILQWSMLAETRAFGARMVDDDLPASSLVDTDFAMLNWRLARHYGLDDAAIEAAGLNAIDGMTPRRVPLPADSLRGGVLTQASVLKVTANGTTTSPVVRGVWVLDRLLGEPPSPPPPGIPAIEPDIRGAVSVRDQLERHRADASCAACHAAIDPPGLALETFDVIGQARTRYRRLHPKHGDDKPAFTPTPRPLRWADGAAVDASGEVDGQAFADLEGYRRILLDDPRKLGRNVTEKLIIYSTGAAPSLADRETVEAILDANEGSGYGVRSLLLDVVASDLFAQK